MELALEKSARPVVEFKAVTKLLSHRHDTGRRDRALQLFKAKWLFKKKNTEETHFAILDKVTLRVRPAEKVLFLCTNPDAQEILVRLLVGVTQPSSGSVRAPKNIRLVTAKMRGQRPLLILRTHILALSAFLGVRRKQALTILDQVVKLLDMKHLLHERVVDIEPIDLVRASYFTMLLCPADTYVFDEIFIPELVEEQLALLKDKTVIFISSKAKFPKELLSMGYVINEGRLIFQGPTDEAATKFEQSVDSLMPVSRELAGDDDDEVDFESGGDVSIEMPRPTPGKAASSGAAGKIQISKVVPVSATPDAPILRSGEDAFFEVYYSIPDPSLVKGGVSASITFRDGRNARVACAWSSYLGQEFSDIPVKGKFTLKVPRFPLTAGKYGLIVSLLINKKGADKLIVSDAFEVKEGDYFGRGSTDELKAYGSVWMPFDWEVGELNP